MLYAAMEKSSCSFQVLLSIVVWQTQSIQEMINHSAILQQKEDLCSARKASTSFRSTNNTILIHIHLSSPPSTRFEQVGCIFLHALHIKLVCPFEMVKRGGIEGETALEDINQQMLMRPTKPIPHPVGDCVARPCASARGFGISGKAVVALTRIHTQGRGSITIVRTRG